MSTMSKRGGMRAVRRMKRCTCLMLSPACTATMALERRLSKFGPTWPEFSLVGLPALLRIASSFILYAIARSLGRMCSLCKLASTIWMMASSRVISLTITRIWVRPASRQARCRRLPETNSYSPGLSSNGLAMAGVSYAFKRFFLPAFPLHLIDNRPQGCEIDKIRLLAVGFH